MRGRIAFNLLLVLVLAALIGAHWLILPDPSRRNVEFLPDMVVSVARDAQAPGPVLADGTVVDFRPPAGSVARGMMPFGYDATPAGALEAGRELIAPVWSAEEESAVADRGAFIFDTFCMTCHGAAGHGDGPATKRGVPPPPSFLADRALNMSDGQMYHVITLGQGNMASYASQVQRADRWRVIRHIRKLQKPPENPPEEPPLAGGNRPAIATPAFDSPDRRRQDTAASRTPDMKGEAG